MSYLCGAVVRNGVLHPRTNYAKSILMRTFALRAIFKRHSIIIGAAIPPDERAPIPGVEPPSHRAR